MSAATSSLTPRLSTSRQWTNLPKEFLEKVEKVFVDQFDIEAENGEFLVEGRVYPSEVIVRVGYLEKGRLKQINFEASMDLAPKKAHADQAANSDEEGNSDSMERLYICIDILGSVMEEYFNLGDEDEIDVPLRWRAYEFEGETVYLQHSTVNTRLEEEADRLLGLAENQLVREIAPTQDALGNAEIDSELAFEIQKAIRNGTYRPKDMPPEDDELN